MSIEASCGEHVSPTENSYSVPELTECKNLPPKRPWKIHILRHGKPTIYGETSADLDMDGVNQTQHFVETLIADLNQTEDKKAIRILYSDRPRTKQTAFWTELGLKRAIKEERLPRTRILGVRRDKFLNTARILDAVVLDGVDPTDAYQTWLNANEDYYRNLNILSPGDVVQATLNQIAKRERNATRLGRGEQIVEIWSTHEVTLGPLTIQLFPEATQVINSHPGETNIRYGEMMKATIGPGDHTVFEFRNHTNPRSL